MDEFPQRHTCADAWRRKRYLVENNNIHVVSITTTPSTTQAFQLHLLQKYPIGPSQGGTAICVRLQLSAAEYTLSPHLSNFQICNISLPTPNGQRIVLNYYCPSRETISTDLLIFVSTFPKAFLLGDFNATHTLFGDTNSNHFILQNNDKLPSFFLSFQLCKHRAYLVQPNPRKTQNILFRHNQSQSRASARE